jgi:threonine dehydrogenase-like Zn-dependent dehydrogenase
MKALVYHGSGKRAWEEKPRPAVQDPGDAILRITITTICGTDLYILKGDVPAVAEGRILGHEEIGVVEQVGTGVSEFYVGDKVIVSCVTACLKCGFCKRGMYSHCRARRLDFGLTPSTERRPSMCASHPDQPGLKQATDKRAQAASTPAASAPSPEVSTT